MLHSYVDVSYQQNEHTRITLFRFFPLYNKVENNFLGPFIQQRKGIYKQKL